jgi:hypothetical protein
MTNLMKLTVVCFATFALVGCGDSSNGGSDGGGGSGGGGGTGTPAKPTLGAQIDRMGRGTINVAVSDPFDDPVKRDMVRDQYNADSNPAMWATNWVPKFQKSLPVYDSVDGTCGNQILAATTVDANRYATFATVLADDRIYLDTSQMGSVYFGVELHTVMAHINTTGNDATTGVAVPANAGGRAPTFDVVALTYSAAAIGTDGIDAMGNGKFDDGAPADPDPNGVNMTTFPFLGTPN